MNYSYSLYQEKDLYIMVNLLEVLKKIWFYKKF